MFIATGGLTSLTPNYLLRNVSLFCYTRRLKRNPTILQDFVPLACNYWSNKRQFFLLPSNLRGRQVSYQLSIVSCVNIYQILFVYNESSHIIINSVFYYHFEQPKIQTTLVFCSGHNTIKHLNIQNIDTFENLQSVQNCIYF